MSLTRALSLLLLVAIAGRSQGLRDLVPPPDPSSPRPIVLGFLGAWERWDDTHRGVRKLALDLRQSNPSLYVETLSNHRRGTALKLIRRALDRNGDGSIDASEAAAARIVLYGQSLGGRAVVKLARHLEKLQIPVLLTVQVDSVGLTDSVIPGNVRSAANVYQRGLFTIWGEGSIRAADPGRTRILENALYLPFDPTAPEPETWARRRLGGGHARMEADPAVWAHVGQLIRNALQ